MAARDTTFCFTDIAGSTDILRRLGESAYDALLERHRTLIRGALVAAGGSEVKTEGDGFFVTFGDPAAALRFAIDAQRALGSEPWPIPVRVRMGFHRGPGTVRADGDYSSLAAHQAARVAAAAHGGQVLVTADVVRDIDPPAGARLVHLGPHRLRDFDGGIELLQVAAPGLDDRFPPVRATREDHGLPLPRTSMVGRDVELRELRALVTSLPLVTLHGPGGVGKTRLALEVAAAASASFPDGLHFVELSPVASADLVVPTVAAAIGVRPGPDQDRLAAIVAFLGRGSHLLVLDSAERVVEEVARLVDAVVRSCPGCTILVTSTEPVRAPEERVVPVAPLRLPADDATPEETFAADAVRLLTQRATTRGASLDEGVEAAIMLGTIARRLDGIPLALELAAGRIADLGIGSTLDGLDDRFSLLTNGWRTSLPRHQTLEAMVDWTVSLLPPQEREVVGRLATLRGRWLPADAVEVCGGDTTVESIHRLVDRSLLWFDGSRPLPRLRMYDTVRAFIERELPPADATELARRKQRWLVQRLTALSDAPDAEIRGELGNLIPDLREAMTPAPDGTAEDLTGAVDLAAMTAPWFEAAGLWDEAIRRLEAAIAMAPEGESRITAVAVLAHLTSLTGGNEAAFQLAQEVVADERAPDRARALSYLVLSPPGAPAGDGPDLLVEAVRLAGSPSASLALAARVRIGLRKIAAGDAEGAVAELTDLAEVAAQHGRTMHHAQALVNLGGALIRTGRIDEAEATLRKGRELSIEAQLPKLAAGCLTNLGMIALFRGDPTAAIALAEERLDISLQMGDLPGAASARMVIGNAAALLGQRDRARDEMRQTYDLFRKIGVVEGCATALFNLVTLAAADGDRADAARTAAELARSVMPVGNPSMHALAFAAVGGVAAEAGRDEGAVLLGALDAHGPAATPLDPADLDWLQRAEAALVAATSSEDVAEARARGRELALTDALELAVAVADDLAG